MHPRPLMGSCKQFRSIFVDMEINYMIFLRGKQIIKIICTILF